MNKQQIRDKVEAWLKSSYEYNTQNDDAAGNYYHCINDGDFDCHDGNERLMSFMRENAIAFPTNQIDQIASEVIDLCEANSGHTMDYLKTDVFNVATFPVGEIEDQFSNEDLMDLLDVEAEELPRVKEIIEGEFCATISDSDVLIYQSTDCTWKFEVGAEQVREIISNL